jgi:hypothetical protein
MTIEEINKEIVRLNILKKELEKKEQEELDNVMSVYIGKYIRDKDNPHIIGMIYRTEAHYIYCDYLEYREQYFEIVSDNSRRYYLYDVDFITKEEFKTTVLNWTSEILKHYNIES